jgi:hypothetical protein
MNQLQHSRNYIDDFIIAVSYNRKISLKYFLTSLPVAVCLGTICFIGKGINSELSLKIFQLITFTATGLFQLYLLKKRIPFFRVKIFGEGFIYTLSMSILICFTLLLFYLFTDKSMAMMAIASSVAFATPHALLQAWIFFENIHATQNSLWIAPLKTTDNNEILIPGEITICFSLMRPGMEDKEETFVRTLPKDWKLGKAFYIILEKENLTPDFQNPAETGSNFGWEFYKEIFNGLIKKRLNPELSFTDNGIVANTVIHIRRINAIEFEEKNDSKIFFE